jgi:hypothetical protein
MVRRAFQRGCAEPNLCSLFANREYRMKSMALKPQDMYVVLKLVAAGPRRVPYSHLALELVMSPSETRALNARGRVVCFMVLVWRIVQT